MANESMKCGISAKPDSSYMPPKPLLLPRITKTGSGLSDEVSREKVVVQRLGGDDTLSPLSCVTSGRCHSSSETSIGESACSIQWSSAEDEVIEANVKEPTASKDVDMVMKVGGHQIPLEEHGLCMTRFKESKQPEASAGYYVDGTTTSKGQCSGEQVGSPETKDAAFQVDDWVRTKGNPATKLKLADEEATCSNQEEDTDKLPPIVEPNRREPSSQCQLLKQTERSDHLYDVKVCDTCGDVGRDYLLASCSKCSDGAEHIYCMRVKLDKVPEGCWICEDCKLEEEKRTEEKQKQKQDIVSVKSGSFCDDKTLLDSKDLAVGNSRTFEGLPSHYSAKRPPSSLVATPTTGKGGIETSGMTSKLTNSIKRAVLPNITSFKKTTNRQVSFRRSESLGNVKRPEKLQLVCGVVNNSRSRRDNRIKTLLKSASLISSQPRYARNSNLRIPSSKSSDIEELKRLKHHNDQSLVRITNALLEARPLAELTATDGNACGSTFGQEILEESVSRILSGPNLTSLSSSAAEIGDSDLPIQGQKQTVAIDLERTAYSTEAVELGGTDLLSEGQNKVAGVALERTSNPTGAARATKITNFVEPLLVGDLPHAIWSTLSTSGMPAIPDSNCVWEGGFLIQQDGRPSGTIGGVQAHISMQATQPVLQNVHEFPQAILLEKVVRVNKWATQFLEEHAKEDNTVFFSLPKELQSFERNDGSLLDCLVADDVCLEGDIGGFKLLIFSSNLLVDGSPSWKKLFPLWGVLKTRTSNCLMDLLPRGEAVPSHTFSLALANSQNSKSSVLSSRNTPCSGTSVIMDMEPNPLPSPTATALVPVRAMKFCTSEINNGNKSLHLPLPNETDSLSWHQQLLLESYASQGDSGALKRRREINLNNENCSNGGWFAKEPEQKRLRTSKETFIYLGFNHADVLANGPDLSLVNGSGSNSAHEQTSGWSVCSEPGIPNLELSLGTPEKPAKPVALKQFLGVVGDSNVGIDHRCAARDYMEDGAWLSLSLSLPTSGKELLQRGPIQTMDIDTSLSLSPSLGN